MSWPWCKAAKGQWGGVGNASCLHWTCCAHSVQDLDEAQEMADAMMAFVSPRVAYAFTKEQRKAAVAGAPTGGSAAASSDANGELERLLCKSCSPACFGYRRGLQLHGPERAGLGVLRIAHQGQREVAIVFISELLANYKASQEPGPACLQAAEQWLQETANLQNYRGTVWKVVLQQHQLIAIPMGCVTFDYVTSAVDIVGHKMNVLLEADKSVESVDAYVQCMQEAGAVLHGQDSEFQTWLWTQRILQKCRIRPLSRDALKDGG